ncbi:putative candidate secreted effector protein [Blumeria hordei DH14]|uniref:Putative candidate secreted effector protein n=1 Tax=Blumeria graminis f. sp. hordei (strain DH14) TaxID=546991 RepID=N1J8E7_BLUG1|nr:putative candidate secreted effector protein [Blumeria hordei DH14]
MRFSSIAIIFQSASIFVTTLAGGKIAHIPESRKSFQCERRLILGSSYERTLFEVLGQIRFKEILPIDKSIIYNLVDQADDSTNVFYEDETPDAFFFHKLEKPVDAIKDGVYVYDTNHILVIDNHGRTCGIVMRTVVRHRSINRSDVPDSGASFMLCTITS